MRILATFMDRRLVQYPSGETRIEDTKERSCSDWLHWTEADRVQANPTEMAAWDLDLPLDATEDIDPDGGVF